MPSHASLIELSSSISSLTECVLDTVLIMRILSFSRLCARGKGAGAIPRLQPWHTRVKNRPYQFISVRTLNPTIKNKLCSRCMSAYLSQLIPRQSICISNTFSLAMLRRYDQNIKDAFILQTCLVHGPHEMHDVEHVECPMCGSTIS